jgi:hypothetical protein
MWKKYNDQNTLLGIHVSFILSHKPTTFQELSISLIEWCEDIELKSLRSFIPSSRVAFPVDQYLDTERRIQVESPNKLYLKTPRKMMLKNLQFDHLIHRSYSIRQGANPKNLSWRGKAKEIGE